MIMILNVTKHSSDCEVNDEIADLVVSSLSV